MAGANDGRITNPLAHSAEQPGVTPPYENVPALLGESEGLCNSNIGNFLDLDSEFQLRFLLGVLRAALDPWWVKPEPRKPVGKPEIRTVLAEIYEEAEAAGRKPPNVNEAYQLVVKRVAPKHAPKSKVMTELKAFAKRRLGRGKRFGTKCS